MLGMRIFCNLLTFTRGIRQRRGQPVKWLQDATTYSDVHSALLDGDSPLPYPPEDLIALMNKVQSKSEKKEEKVKNSERKGINFDHIPIQNQVVVLFPGQGSQFVGMGSKVLDCPTSCELYEKASEILGYNLLEVCMKGPRSKLDQTIYCQPAMFVSSLAAWEKLKCSEENILDNVSHVAGFSVGELAALVLAGVLSFENALKFVKIRAELMHEHSQKIASGMLTIRTSAISELQEAMTDAKSLAKEKGELPICEVANYLFCNVKVVGASETCMEYLIKNHEKYKYQVVKKLAVSGAFHTSLMNGTLESLKKTIEDIDIASPCINVYSNYTGGLYTASVLKIKNFVTNQVCNVVKWEQIQQKLFNLQKDFNFPRYIEVGPGRQLGAMFHNVSKKAYAYYSNFPA